MQVFFESELQTAESFISSAKKKMTCDLSEIQIMFKV